MNRYHPVFRLLLIFTILLITMFCQSVSGAVISFVGAAAAVLMTKDIKGAAKDIAFSFCLLALMTITNPLFSHRGKTPLFFINDLPYTLESLVYGADLGISLVAMIMWFSVLNRLVSKSDMLYMFGKFAPKTALTISMVMGYIPKIKLKLTEISRAQKGSGIFTSESKADRICFGGTIFAAVTAWSTESSAETAQAMRARGYGYSRRSSAQARRFRPTDIATIAVTALLLATSLFGYANGGGKFSFYPAVTFPESDIYTYLFYAALAVLAFLPAFLIAKEKLKWKYLTAKI